MKTFYLIIDPPQEAAINMSTDLVLLKLVSAGKLPPILRIYSWYPTAATIGYFQIISDEINEAAADNCGVKVIRRITGGGAVLHDNEITYSFIAPQNIFPHDVMTSFEKICTPIIRSLKQYSANAAFSGINDICVSGRKISGNAQTRRYGSMLQHGTIIIDADIQKMFSILTPPPEKFRTGKKLISLKELSINPDNLINQIVFEFQNEFECTFENYTTDNIVRNDIKYFADNLFRKEEWNLKRISNGLL